MSAANARLLMPPPASEPPTRKVAVLQEDVYTETIEAIVERDYFPHVPKMRNQLEWLQAVKTGDPFTIKQAQLNIQKRRAGFKTPLPSETAGRANTSLLTTPGLATPALTPLPLGIDTIQAPGPLEASLKAPKMSLDQFLATHSGEDNHSFKQLQQEEVKRKRMKYAHHLEDKNQPLLLEGPFPTDGFGTTGQAPGTLVPWKHSPKSSFFYDTSQREALRLTEKELANQTQGPPKQTVAANTRLDTEQEGASAVPVAKENMPSSSTSAVAAEDRGYNYLRTPNIIPGADASPFVTWGEIDGTPIRLEMEDVAIDPREADGPQFRMPAAPKRDVLLRSLAAKATASHSTGAKHNTPGLGKAATPMSAAAVKLVSSVTRSARAGGADAQLRASYSTPTLPGAAHSRTPMTTPLSTPGRTPSTPRLGPSSAQPPKHTQQSQARAHITDDLLKLS